MHAIFYPHDFPKTQKIKDLRLQLLMENISNIRAQRVRSVMVPWGRVRSLPASADRKSVLAQVSQERFSRWPVVESATGRVRGYLLTKDLIAHAIDGDWSPLIRPLRSVRADDVASVLTRMQAESATAYLVEEDSGQPVGLFTWCSSSSHRPSIPKHSLRCSAK